MSVFICLIIPFIGTSLGAALVFLMKNKINNKLEKILLGFASGVMVAASFFSLLLPSIKMAEDANIISWLPASLGFILGILFLLLLDNIIPHLHIKSKEKEGPNLKLKKTTMMVLAITLHNIPEGMAVGVIVAGFLSNNLITIMSAMSLSIGIAIQNFPEGAIISMPLKEEGMKKSKSFLCGVLSGIVEPISALITILATSLVLPILPYILSFAAGTMIYVVIEELIPESQVGKHSNMVPIGFSLGFVLMMILDIALS